MSQSSLADSPGPLDRIESRRSTRIERSVPLLISGLDGLGQEFMESTSSLSVNLHGCRYPSRHTCLVGSWITLRVADPSTSIKNSTARAQVKSIHMPNGPREMMQIGVELEAPANIWGVSTPPVDWILLLGEKTSSTSTQISMEPGKPRPSIVMEMPHPVRPAMEPPVPPVREESAGEEKSSPPRPNRIVVTPERLLSALQGRAQELADSAVQQAIAKHLKPAVERAIASIDSARQASLQQVQEITTQQRSAIVHSSRDELLARLDDRLDEVRSRWDAQLDGFRVRAEEIVQRIDRQATTARKDLDEAREAAEKAMQALEPELGAHLAQSLAHAREEFERGSAQAADRHLVRVVEEARSVTREATMRMELHSSEVRASIESAARMALEEFRRQAEIHASVTASDTAQRVTSALAALDAQHRIACDARQRSVEEEVAQIGTKITDEFRQSLRAYFYSCLVAAVGAVEDHSKATLDSLALNPTHLPPPKS